MPLARLANGGLLRIRRRARSCPTRFLILARGRRGRRLPAALHRVRTLRLRDRRQPRGRRVLRHPRAPGRDPDLRDLGASRAASPASATRPTSGRCRSRWASPTSSTRSRRRCSAGVSLRGGEGTVRGLDHRLVHHAGDRQRHQHVPVALPRRRAASARILRLDHNWTFIIIGAVILVAVVLDQVAHIVQAKRRTRRAGALAAGPPVAAP